MRYAMRRRDWRERKDGLHLRYDNEESTVETNCPICVLGVSNECKGDYEGCRRFERPGGHEGDS